MCGRGLRRSPTRPRLTSGKRGDQLHRTEREGAIGKRDSAHPARSRAHASGGGGLQALFTVIPAQRGVFLKNKEVIPAKAGTAQ